MNENKDYKILTPFKLCVLQNFPFIEADFDALTNYGLLCKIVEYLNKVIAQQNAVTENQKATIQAFNEFTKNITGDFNDLVTKFNTLKDYVDTYFENLDVQDEINNKLDEFVADGTLDNILMNYANLTKTYKTYQELLQDTTLVAGMKLKTMGYYTVNDGGGAEYVTATELNPNAYVEQIDGLYVELISKNNIINVKSIGCYGDNIHDDTEILQSIINFVRNKNLIIYIPYGTYLISNISVLENTTIKSNKAILKSINNNTNNNIIKLNKSNIFIDNIIIDGNKENNNITIDGLLYDYDSYVGDSNSLLTNIIVQNCSGNGININSSRIINVKMENCISRYNNINGFIIQNSTDNKILNSESYFNTQCGFKIGGSNNIIANCKSNTNGRGDESTIDISRTPADAYVITSDTTPISGKTYYTRSGSSYNDNPYKFTIFTGTSFSSGTSYYELSKNYYKRYAGYEINSRRTVLNNCESQDNFGDGFLVTANNVCLNGVNGDGNGYLCLKGGNINDRVSYASQNLTQIYDGVHFLNCNSNVLTGTFSNHRYTSELGAFQRTGVCLDNSFQIDSITTSTNQVSNTPIILTNFTNNNIINNGSEYVDNYDLSRLSILTNNYNIYNENNANKSYIKKIGKTVFIKLIITNTNGTGTSLNDDILITQLPERFRPSFIEHNILTFSTTYGYNINNQNIANSNIYTNGNVAIRGYTGNNNTSCILNAIYNTN